MGLFKSSKGAADVTVCGRNREFLWLAVAAKILALGLLSNIVWEASIKFILNDSSAFSFLWNQT